MEDITFFNELYATEGGRFNNATYNRYLDRMRQTVQLMYENEPNLPLPYLDFVFNTSINASAAKYKGRYFIGIYAGAVFMIANLINRMLASNNLFPHIGNVEDEKDPRKIYTAEAFSIDHIDVQDQPVPTCKTRATYAQIMIDNALDFLVAHEYAHILFGHCDLIAKHGNKVGILELENKGASLSAADWQTLEVDADMFATNIGIHTMDHCLLHPELIPIPCQMYFKTWHQALQSWLFPVTLISRIFSKYNSLDYLKTHSHPVPALRNSLIETTLVSFFMKIVSEKELTLLTKQIRNIYWQVETSFQAVSEKQIDHSPLKFLDLPEVEAQAAFLLENWKHVRPKLQPYSFIDLRRILME